MDVCSSLTSRFEVYSFDLNISGFGGHFSVSGVSQAETPPGSAYQDLSFICPLFVNCLCVSVRLFFSSCLQCLPMSFIDRMLQAGDIVFAKLSGSLFRSVCLGVLEWSDDGFVSKRLSLMDAWAALNGRGSSLLTVPSALTSMWELLPPS